MTFVEAGNSQADAARKFGVTESCVSRLIRGSRPVYPNPLLRRVIIMFDPDFYPTPKPLVHTMLQGLDLRNKYILEPSAGKGDILDVITAKANGWQSPQLRAIELNPDLRSVLEGKGYTVVFDDFLNYMPNLNFDYIIMNPPFSDCLDHILKAWDILDDGMVISVMPVTALEGKTAKEQLLLHRIEQSGTQPELVGQAFKYSERPTDVEVAVVRLVKRGTNFKMGFEVKNDQERPDEETEEELNAQATGQEVAVTGYVNDLLAHFQAAVANYAAYNEARVKIERYIAPIHKFYDGDHTIEVMETADEKKKPSERYNTFVDLLQQAAWVKVLDHPGFQSLLTDRARKAMTEFRQRQRRVDFNEFNIRAMFAEIYAQKDALLDAAIQDAFDNMTKYHEVQPRAC